MWAHRLAQAGPHRGPEIAEGLGPADVLTLDHLGRFLSQMKTIRPSRRGAIIRQEVGTGKSVPRKVYDVKWKLKKLSHSGVMEGYKIGELTLVARSFGIQPVVMAKRIGVSKSTFHRRAERGGTLTLAESDSLARYASLLAQATKVFDGDQEAAKSWLSCPQVGLGDHVPIDLAKTTFGFQEVEKLLTRIDRGVYA